MPLVKSEFRINLLDFKHHGNNLLEHMKKRAGSDMGVKVVEAIPFKKDEEKSFKISKGESIDEINRFNPPPYEYYKLELFVTSGEEWQTFKNKLYFALSDVGKGTKDLIGLYLKHLENSK